MKLRYRINQGMLVALVGLVATAVYAEESAVSYTHLTLPTILLV